jgi:hypothetical protein
LFCIRNANLPGKNGLTGKQNGNKKNQTINHAGWFDFEPLNLPPAGNIR